MFCPKCGKSNPDQASFCGACGNKLPKLTAAGPVTVQEPTTTPAAPTTPMTPTTPAAPAIPTVPASAVQPYAATNANYSAAAQAAKRNGGNRTVIIVVAAIVVVAIAAAIGIFAFGGAGNLGGSGAPGPAGVASLFGQGDVANAVFVNESGKLQRADGEKISYEVPSAEACTVLSENRVLAKWGEGSNAKYAFFDENGKLVYNIMDAIEDAGYPYMSFQETSCSYYIDGRVLIGGYTDYSKVDSSARVFCLDLNGKVLWEVNATMNGCKGFDGGYAVLWATSGGGGYAIYDMDGEIVQKLNGMQYYGAGYYGNVGNDPEARTFKVWKVDGKEDSAAEKAVNDAVTYESWRPDELGHPTFFTLGKGFLVFGGNSIFSLSTCKWVVPSDSGWEMGMSNRFAASQGLLMIGGGFSSNDDEDTWKVINANGEEVFSAESLFGSDGEGESAEIKWVEPGLWYAVNGDGSEGKMIATKDMKVVGTYDCSPTLSLFQD